MLEKNPEKRLSASEALKMPFVIKHAEVCLVAEAYSEHFKFLLSCWSVQNWKYEIFSQTRYWYWRELFRRPQTENTWPQFVGICICFLLKSGSISRSAFSLTKLFTTINLAIILFQCFLSDLKILNSVLICNSSFTHLYLNSPWHLCLYLSAAAL